MHAYIQTGQTLISPFSLPTSGNYCAWCLCVCVCVFSCMHIQVLTVLFVCFLHRVTYYNCFFHLIYFRSLSISVYRELYRILNYHMNIFLLLLPHSDFYFIVWVLLCFSCFIYIFINFVKFSDGAIDKSCMCSVGLDLTNAYTLYQNIEHFKYPDSSFILFRSGSSRGSHCLSFFIFRFFLPLLELYVNGIIQYVQLLSAN